jgi:acyl-coenzyme A thioesterase PaaI-like protein
MAAAPEDLIALMPFARQLGIVLDETSADRVVARLDWAPQLCTAGGVMHGES